MEATLQRSMAAKIYIIQHHYGVSVLRCHLDIPVSMYFCAVRSLVPVDQNRDGRSCAQHSVDFLRGLVRHHNGWSGAGLAGQNRRLQVL